MLNDIILGFKDVVKDKVIVMFYSIFFSFIMFITISSTKSLLKDIFNKSNEIDNAYETFNTYIIGLKSDHNKRVLDDLSLLYQKNSYSFCNAILSTDKNENIATYLLFGEIPEFYSYLKSDKEIDIFVGKDCDYIKYVYLNNNKYYVNSVINNSKLFYVSPTQVENTNDKVFIIINNPVLPDWLVNNDEVYYQLIKNTHILKNDNQRLTDFVKLANTDFLKVIPNNMEKDRLEVSAT